MELENCNTCHGNGRIEICPACFGSGKFAYRLDVTYPMAKFPKFDSIVTEAVGTESVSSGCGFGTRDLEFHFATREGRATAAERIYALRAPLISTCQRTDLDAMQHRGQRRTGTEQ